MWSWEDYFIPGTNVLRNKFTTPTQPFGEANPVRLRQLEEIASNVRMQELKSVPILGAFDYVHMKAIHRYIFQDVYDWAGEERTAPTTFMTKNGYPYYPAGPALKADANKLYRALADDNYLRELEFVPFVERLAEYWGELNVIHSFREGNTRTQFVFFSQLAEFAGYRLAAEVFNADPLLRQDFNKARFQGQATASNAALAVVLSRIIIPASQH